MMCNSNLKQNRNTIVLKVIFFSETGAEEIAVIGGLMYGMLGVSETLFKFRKVSELLWILETQTHTTSPKSSHYAQCTSIVVLAIKLDYALQLTVDNCGYKKHRTVLSIPARKP